MKHPRFALLIAEKPAKDKADELWQDFLTRVKGAEKERADASATWIHDNVCLIPLETGLLYFGKMLERSSTIPMRVLFLKKEPAWVGYPPIASSTEDQAQRS